MKHPSRSSRSRGPGDRESAPSSGSLAVPSNARELAFEVLQRSEHSGEFVNRVLDERLAVVTLSAADRRLVTELVYGTVRRTAMLDAIIRPLVKRPPSQVELDLWLLLRIGVYQLVVLSQIPPRASVHATVELAKWAGGYRWNGFVNGVLRALDRQLTDEETTSPASDAVPLTSGRYRRVGKAVFPDPQQHPARYVATAFSLPDWLVERWLPRFGLEQLLQIGWWYLAPATLSLRVNLLKGSRAELLEEITAAGISAEPGELEEVIRLSQAGRVDELPGFAAGAFSIQDESAVRAGRLLAPKPGERVLDLCAAPGGKTTHLAELMENQGEILATDVQTERLGLVRSSAHRLGLDIIRTKSIAPDLHDLPAGPFDAVLADVPCSNTGVLGKRPDARWRISPRDLEELPEVQFRLLQAAASRVAERGRLVYSTCSMEPEENEQVIERFLAAAPEWERCEDHLHIAGGPADGGYQALLRRSSGVTR